MNYCAKVHKQYNGKHLSLLIAKGNSQHTNSIDFLLATLSGGYHIEFFYVAKVFTNITDLHNRGTKRSPVTYLKKQKQKKHTHRKKASAFHRDIQMKVFSISFWLEINLVLAKLREVKRSNRLSCPSLDTQIYI